MVRKSKKYFVISIASEILEVHPQTLRQFEREGLVKPSRSQGNVRLYSEEDIERVRMILRLRRELGVNLAGIEVILGMREKMEEMQREMLETFDQMQRYVATELARRNELMKQPLAKRPRRDIVKIKIEEDEE
ncbi:MAG: helix-turn-helix transcriptional regulator [Nitrospirota bacterium]|nr:helix-turn-helix transcriptional regulator [Nitrospirota bacterium]